jgi:uncharacterized protein (UPF0179 family)
VEEVISVDLSYAELWQVLESGTVVEGSPIHKKLMAAREAFERKPKVYGRGLAIKLVDSSTELKG